MNIYVFSKKYMYLMNILSWGNFGTVVYQKSIFKATKIYCIPTIKGIRGHDYKHIFGRKPNFFPQFIQRKINPEKENYPYYLRYSV